MASTTCSICIQQMKTSDPAVYCPQCNELMCQSCSDTHNQADKTRNHEVMPYQDYQKLPPFILNTSMNCSQHQYKYEEYCRMHDELACKECKRRFHSECEEVLKIEDVVYNVKDSVLFTDTFSEIEDLCGNLKDIFEDRNKNIKQLKICHKEIETTIQNKFDNIIEHLKKLKDRTISELNSVHTELTNEISNTLEIIHSEEEKLSEILDQKDSIKKHATNYQTFVSLKEMEKMLQEMNTKLNKPSDNDKLNQYNMELKTDESIEDIVSGIQSLGDIKVTKSPSSVSIQNTEARYLEAVKEVKTPAPVDWITMATTTCSICIKQMKTSDPAVYCPQCNELMCQSCSDTHNQADKTRSHEVMLYQDYQKLPPFILNTSMNCSQHQKRYEDYCRMHDELACKECKRRFHSECEEVLKIEDVVYNVKDSVLFEDTMIEIEALRETLTEVLEDRNKNIIHLKTCCKDIEKTIENKFDNIIKHLKKLKDMTISELNTEYTELTKDLSYTSEIIHSEEKKLSEILDQKDSITKHATNYQTFVGLKEMEKMLQETNVKLNELPDNDNLKQYTIEFDMNETLEDIVSDILSIGDIRVIKSPSTLSIQNTDPRYLEAIKEVQTPAPVQLYLQQKIDLEHGLNTGCCALPCGMVIANSGDISGNDCKVLIHKSNGSLRSTIKFKEIERVGDVTSVDDCHIAVSHPKSGTISIIDVNKGFIYKGKVVKILNIEIGVRSLCCRGPYLVCCVEDKGLVSVNIDSEEVETVMEDENVDEESHVEVSISLICYTCPQTDTIKVLDTQYNVIFTYKDEALLNCPIGVTIDDHSNIYVTGYYSNNLVVISSDGKSSHQLLGKYDGLYYPKAVYYDSSTKRLVVVNKYGGPAFLYSIK